MTGRDAAEELIGTCKELNDVVDDPALLDDLAFLNEVDQHALQCDVCGWWDETSEFCEDELQTCRECCGHDHD